MTDGEQPWLLQWQRLAEVKDAPVIPPAESCPVAQGESNGICKFSFQSEINLSELMKLDLP